MRWLKRLWRKIVGTDDGVADILKDAGDPRLAERFKNVQQEEPKPPAQGGGGTFGGGGASGGW